MENMRLYSVKFSARGGSITFVLMCLFTIFKNSVTQQLHSSVYIAC